VYEAGAAGGLSKAKDDAINVAATANFIFDWGESVWGWGRNTEGQLGLGDYHERLAPVRVEGLEDVVGVALGEHHSLALTKEGEVWSWGKGSDGQLGHGDKQERRRPQHIKGMNLKSLMLSVLIMRIYFFFDCYGFNISFATLPDLELTRVCEIACTETGSIVRGRGGDYKYWGKVEGDKGKIVLFPRIILRDSLSLWMKFIFYVPYLLSALLYVGVIVACFCV
jgi:alpha-tubulin suppressor-like RCC1 family protein